MKRREGEGKREGGEGKKGERKREEEIESKITENQNKEKCEGRWYEEEEDNERLWIKKKPRKNRKGSIGLPAFIESKQKR